MNQFTNEIYAEQMENITNANGKLKNTNQLIEIISRREKYCSKGQASYKDLMEPCIIREFRFL